MSNETAKQIATYIKTKQKSISEVTLDYLERIKTYDGYLNSIAVVNPDLDQIIKDLESNPKDTPLYGVPIVIKDNIQTSDRMPTTANSYALKDFIAPFDATIVKKVREAGMVLLGKANLSEFAYFMSYDDMPSGYGSLHGQVVNPYHKEIDPLGSSTGSAVSVAADLVPLSIGTETNGSLMAPAYKNSITSIKPSLGFVSRYGIIPISQFQDTPGPMAKTVEDCALLLDVIYGYDPNDPYTEICKSYKPNFYEATKRFIKNKTIAILNYTYKDFKYSEEDTSILNEAKEIFAKLGAHVIDIEFELDDLKNDETLLYEFKHDLNHYFMSLKDNIPIDSLKTLIAFNESHKERCLKYGQSIFTAAEKTSGDLNDIEYKEKKQSQMKIAAKLEEILKEYQIDAAISTIRNSYAPIYGSPTISVPAKALTDKNPVSIVFFGKKYDDETLISIAHQYEIHTNHRIPPILKKD